MHARTRPASRPSSYIRAHEREGLCLVCQSIPRIPLEYVRGGIRTRAPPRQRHSLHRPPPRVGGRHARGVFQWNTARLSRGPHDSAWLRRTPGQEGLRRRGPACPGIPCGRRRHIPLEYGLPRVQAAQCRLRRRIAAGHAVLRMRPMGECGYAPTGDQLRDPDSRGTATHPTGSLSITLDRAPSTPRQRRARDAASSTLAPDPCRENHGRSTTTTRRSVFHWNTNQYSMIHESGRSRRATTRAGGGSDGAR